jgi:outer membrane protein assembly factor BamA
MKQPIRHFFFLLMFIGVFASCTVVKKYDPGVPFIFENTVKIQGVADKEKLLQIKSGLEEQIEDSVRVNDVSKLPWPKFPWIIPVPVIEKPESYDTAAIRQTMVNMRYYMANMGYKSSVITVDSVTKRHKKQQRIKVTYNVQAGRLFTIGSVIYAIRDSTLQLIAQSVKHESSIKKGFPLEESVIGQELNRLVGVFQNNGYYKFSPDDIYAELDSGFSELIDPTLDPFEYVQKLSALNERRAKPTVDIYIRIRNNQDTTRFQTYKVKSFTVYPDTESESTLPTKDTSFTQVDNINVIAKYGTFKPEFIAEQVKLKPGQFYTREKYGQTLNNFNRLGAWRNINIFGNANDSSRTIDYLLKLSPAKKQFFSVDLEGSSIINTAQVTTVGYGKVGLAVNFTLRNRNIGKKAIILENTLRTGIEFNNFKKILSGEITLTNRLTIPWMAIPNRDKFEGKFKSGRTIVSADLSYIDRFQYFTLRSFNTFLGYEWKPSNATTWQVRPLNFEFTRFNPDSLFKESLKEFPLLAYTYNNGLIIGSTVQYNHNFNPLARRRINLLKVSAEASGLLTGAIFRNATDSGEALGDLYRFIKVDIDFRHIVQFTQSSLHLRAFAGYGLAFQTNRRKGDVTLPFFKSYTAGGPNSMRGWQIRKLGIGSNIFFDTLVNGQLNDKYADIQLEANLEYRFNLFQFFGFWMRGAIFTDIGNIWYRNDVNGALPRADLNFSRFYKDLAVASGFGARIDFSYFLIRFDLGFPIKDPRYGPYNTGDPKADQFYTPNKYSWFVDGVWNKPSFQFAIGYPF